MRSVRSDALIQEIRSIPADEDFAFEYALSNDRDRERERERKSYRRWTKYSNPGQLDPPRPPNLKVVFFFQGLRCVDKRNQTPQHDMSRDVSRTLFNFEIWGLGRHADVFVRV